MILRAAFWSLGAVLLLGMGHSLATGDRASTHPGVTASSVRCAVPALSVATNPEGVRACQRPPASSGDPFQATARLALAGKWGKLPAWKREAYERVLAQGITVRGKAKVTSYGPWESPAMSGGPFAWLGSQRVRLNEAHCASNPEIPKGSIIWTSYGLRFVVDRGGWVKVGGRFTQRGESANFDYWNPRELSTIRNAPYAIIRRGW